MRTASRNRRLLWRGGVALSYRCGAFTMVEMLAVLMILTILVALAVGVGVHVMAESKRKQTIATQQIVIEAIQVYHDRNNKYPDEETDGTDDCSEVMTELLTDKNASALLKGLSSEVYANATDSPLLDAYQNPMRYRKSGGLGGGPVLISEGKDGSSGVRDSGTASGGTGSDLEDTSKTWTADQWAGLSVRVNSGGGSGQSREITTNTDTVLTVSSAWGAGAGSIYQIFSPGDESDNIRSDGR